MADVAFLPPNLDREVAALVLEPRFLAIVREVLARHIPGCAVWAFGSRATGVRVKPFSDLDLAIEGRLTAEESVGLIDDFDESILPIKVDLVELALVTPEFRQRIEQDFVPVQIASGHQIPVVDRG